MANTNKLVILTDLWGRRDLNWIEPYAEYLKSYFDLSIYDSTELAEISIAFQNEELIHSQFINGGIDNAAKNISLLLKDKSVHILGFSIGGLIVWKAILAGMKAESLTAVSSTRLRNEEQGPTCPISLHYGADDENKPNEKWFEKMNLEARFHKNMTHNFYHENEMVKIICDDLINGKSLTIIGRK